jgi:hypothetical protein
MLCFQGRAKGFSILGVIITVMLLFGISCGSNGTTTDVSKSVSTFYWVRGAVVHDTNDNRVFDGDDHYVAGIPIVWTINGGAQQGPVYTNQNGQFTIGPLPADAEVDVWPLLYQSDYDTYDPPYWQAVMVRDEYVIFWGYSS